MTSLTTDQVKAVGSGLEHSSDDHYEFVALPTNPKVPDWVTALQIDWMLGWANRPRIVIKTKPNPFGWEHEWVYEDGYWRSYSKDGRLQQHYHSGHLTWHEVEKVWQTSPDKGYGGRCFDIQMAEGSAGPDGIVFTANRRDVVLHGPWSSDLHPRYRSVDIYDHDWESTYETRPWYNRMLYSGLLISDELLLSLVAHFEPSVRMAKVCYNGITTLDPIHESWDRPKQFFGDRHGRLGRVL